MSEIVLKVGKKGEIYTTKEIRKKIGIKEGSSVVAYIIDGMLIIEPIPDINEKIKRCVIKLSPEEIERISEEAQIEEGIYG
ncbi:MAG: hypothetical protein DRO40_13550 [Thermoprotei archaeon]|nr:MAG: hypothetical protein DRO40_13550 [Thermoprotei archaeon]